MFSKTNERICQAIADLWEELGGDAEGFMWVEQKRVLEILREREEEERKQKEEEKES